MRLVCTESPFKDVYQSCEKSCFLQKKPAACVFQGSIRVTRINCMWVLGFSVMCRP